MNTNDLMKPYGFDDFQKDVQSMQPRLVDIWVIPPLMMWFAYAAKSMPRWPRRALFSAGIYMIYRNWTSYQTSVKQMATLIPSQQKVI